MRNFVPVTIFASLRKFCHRLLGGVQFGFFDGFPG
jgi:hypothetical protein